MRILTFSTLYPNAVRPNHGIFVETRLRKLLESGKVKASVIAPVPWFPWRSAVFGEYALHAQTPRAEMRNDIEVLHPRYPAPPKIGMNISPLLLYRAMVPVLERLIRREHFDIIDAHYFYPDGIAAVMLGRRLNKPVVVTARGTDINLIAQYALPRRMIRWAAENAAGIVAVSQALRQGLVNLGIPPERIQVLRNGVDLHLFRPADRKSTPGTTHRTLLSVGNLLEFKGHGIAIEALRSLPQCELVIIGSGPDRAKFESMARRMRVLDRVRFLGSVPQSALREHYSAADALVLASSREGWPNVLLEAMACGTPVVACRVGGTSEIVTSPEAGVLLPERTSEALAHGLDYLLRHYPERAATRRHAEQFSWSATTAGQIRLFDRVLSVNAETKSNVRHLRTPAI